jgi:hypothetical protein
MKKLIAAIGGTVLVTAAVTAVGAAWYFGQDVPEEGAVVTTLPSSVLGEDRQVIVHPPESYQREPSRRYPVIYVLDGSSQDGHTAKTAALLARIGVMPELIVVGLPNVSGMGRQRDYTPPFMRQDIDEAGSGMGQGDRFLQFIKAEVIPEIEGRYRTTGARMLAGHSRGALLVTYSLMHEPDLFQARFAHSPALWREDAVMVTKLREHLAAHPVPGAFYMSMGGAEAEHMVAAFDRLRDVLAERAPASLRWRADRIPGADHQKNGEWATPVGLKWFYAPSPDSRLPTPDSA